MSKHLVVTDAPQEECTATKVVVRGFPKSLHSMSKCNIPGVVDFRGGSIPKAFSGPLV